MPRFIVRVELPGKPHADYAALHRDMWKAHYRRVIEGGNGWWHLPHAEYTGVGECDVTAVRDEVRKIAEKQHSKARVFATQSGALRQFEIRR